jgi:hypothetical protein
MTAAKQEAYVRERWEIGCTPPPSRHYSSKLYSDPFKLSAYVYLGPHRIQPGGRNRTEADVWQLAYDFTIAREKQIAEVGEEITWLEGFSAFAEHSVYGPARERILARERAALAELRRGWKGTV